MAALARRFRASASTVRRGLQRLSGIDAVRRTYGGAILAGPPAEASFEQRLSVNGAQKRMIARAALALVEDGQTLILDAGSTVTAFGRSLLDRRLRVITNNLALLPILAQAPRIEVVVLGGRLRPTSLGTAGPLAV